MHRIDRSCHWCGELKPTFRIPAHALRSAATIALVIGVAAGFWKAGPSLRAVASSVGREPAPARTPRVVVAENSVPSRALADAGLPVAPSLADSVVYMSANEGALVPTGDSIQWTPAVARTWVNVRSDASRGGEVVGVIKPASRAMLGTDRAGWRQVRSTEVSGWVDPRLFEPDSLRTRGE